MIELPRINKVRLVGPLLKQDGLYWTSRKNNLELIGLSIIDTVSFKMDRNRTTRPIYKGSFCLKTKILTLFS